MTRTEQRRPETGIRYSALAAGLAITPCASARTSRPRWAVVHRYGRPLVALGQRIVAAAVGIAVIDIASGAPPVRA